MKTLLKWLRRIVFTLVALGTLLALAAAIVNYRGHRAWETCRRDLESRGEVLDWRRFASTPVPDGQNFYKTALLAPLTDWVIDPKTGRGELRDTNAAERIKTLFSALNPVFSVPSVGSWRLGEFTDLGAWEKALREDPNPKQDELRLLLARPPGHPAADVLWLLGRRAAELEEIREASRRPEARFGIRWQDGADALLPHLAVVKTFARVFATRALAELATGQPDAAAEDVRTCLRLAHTLRDEPLLITTLVELAVIDVSIQPLWEGLARHAWTDTHLAALSADLGKINLVEDMLRSLRTERAFSLLMVDNLSYQSLQAPAYGGEGGPTLSSSVVDGIWRGPLRQGWMAWNKAAIAEMYQAVVLPVFDVTNRTVDLGRNAEADSRIAAALGHRTTGNALAALLLPAVTRAGEKAAGAQSTLNLAQIACALERTRLANGAYAARLDELAPPFLASLPHEVVDGQPYHYRREAPDRFTLYSVGPNLKDDGGIVAVDRKRQALRYGDGGDWVWQYQPVLTVTNTMGSAARGR